MDALDSSLLGALSTCLSLLQFFHGCYYECITSANLEELLLTDTKGTTTMLGWIGLAQLKCDVY